MESDTRQPVNPKNKEIKKMTLPFNPEQPPSIELTIGERIDEYHGTQGMLRFPVGSAPHARASKDIEWMRPALIVAMAAEGITHARTKAATATISDDGTLTVARWELPS